MLANYLACLIFALKFPPKRQVPGPVQQCRQSLLVSLSVIVLEKKRFPLVNSGFIDISTTLLAVAGSFVFLLSAL